jgi:hypothetical protein
MEPFVALIVAVTVSSYVPLTVFITERRGRVGGSAGYVGSGAHPGRPCPALSFCLHGVEGAHTATGHGC